MDWTIAVHGSLLLAVATVACGRESQPTTERPAPVGLPAVLDASAGFVPDSATVEGVTLYYRPGGYAGERLASLRSRARAARRDVLALLGLSDFPRLHIFYVDSRDELHDVTGRAANGVADPASRSVVLVVNESWSPFERHEIMHVVSLTRWGQPGHARSPAERREAAWLREGLAAAAENRCGGASNRDVVAAMMGRGRSIDLATLTTRFHLLDDLDAYLHAGTLVEYLLSTYGREKFRETWNEGAIEPRVYGTPVHRIEADWRAWLAASPTAVPAEDLDRVRERGCG